MTNTLGERLEIIKEENRLSVESFMETCEASKATYHNWVAGKSFPTADVLVRILVKFPFYRAEWLLMGIGKMKEEGDNNVVIVKDPQMDYGKNFVTKQDLKKMFKGFIDQIDVL